MTKDLWLNLPVKDLDKTREFFTALGAKPMQGAPSETMAGFTIGNVPVMFILEETFTSFARIPLSDTGKGCEVLVSFGANTRDEIDEMAQKVTKAGGNLFAPPEVIQGWMYGCAFADLDGHRWNMLYMDTAK